jgi:L-ascorbate 6-phosphate lactonase
MTSIREHPLASAEAALWWLGQAGYVIRADNLTIVIDPYLTDSAAANAPEFSRLYPTPIQPEELRADIYIVTHDHLDHLDPETVRRYAAKSTTWFVAPRLTVRHLAELGIPAERILRTDVGESRQIATVEITGTFALPTGADVLDTSGYLLRFSNGRTLYHTSDTAFHPLVLTAAPRKPDVMLVPINGKWGNTRADEAAEFAATVQPRFVLPNHYDLMALNAENPETFRWFCQHRGLAEQCVIAQRMKPFIWR